MLTVILFLALLLTYATADQFYLIDEIFMEKNLTTRPLPRHSAAMWSTQEGVFYLFGGEYHNADTNTRGFYNDLWKYQNNSWQFISGDRRLWTLSDWNGNPNRDDTRPHPRSKAIVISDPSGNTMWLYGGRIMNGNTNYYYEDLWLLFSNGAWQWKNGAKLATNTVASVTTKPCGRFGGGGFRRKVSNTQEWIYIIGGRVAGYAGQANANSITGEVWEYNVIANTWAKRTSYGDESAPTTPGISEFAYWYTGDDGFVDPKFYIFGGYGRTSMGDGPGYLGMLWVFDPIDKVFSPVDGSDTIMDLLYTYPTSGSGPGPRARTSFGYDFASKRAIVYGGSYGEDKPLLNDTWFYNTQTQEWFMLSPFYDITKDVDVPAKESGSMAFLSERGWLFGGFSGNASTGDLWVNYLTEDALQCLPGKETGTDGTNFFCFNCLERKYKSTFGGNDTCKACEILYSTTTTGQGASRCYCKPGYERVSDSSSACVPCRDGYYKQQLGNEPCSRCPIGSQSNYWKTDCECGMGFKYGTGNLNCIACPSGWLRTYNKTACLPSCNYALSLSPVYISSNDANHFIQINGIPNVGAINTSIIVEVGDIYNCSSVTSDSTVLQCELPTIPDTKSFSVQIYTPTCAQRLNQRLFANYPFINEIVAGSIKTDGTDSITIKGFNFNCGDFNNPCDIAVYIGGVQATINSYQSDNEIQVKAPPGIGTNIPVYVIKDAEFVSVTNGTFSYGEPFLFSASIGSSSNRTIEITGTNLGTLEWKRFDGDIKFFLAETGSSGSYAQGTLTDVSVTNCMGNFTVIRCLVPDWFDEVGEYNVKATVGGQESSMVNQAFSLDATSIIQRPKAEARLATDGMLLTGRRVVPVNEDTDVQIKLVGKAFGNNGYVSLYLIGVPIANGLVTQPGTGAALGNNSFVGDSSNGLVEATVTYKSSKNFFGTYSFTFEARDGVGQAQRSSKLVTVNVEVSPVPDALTFEQPNLAVDTSGAITFNIGIVDPDYEASNVYSLRLTSASFMARHLDIFRENVKFQDGAVAYPGQTPSLTFTNVQGGTANFGLDKRQITQPYYMQPTGVPTYDADAGAWIRRVPVTFDPTVSGGAPSNLLVLRFNVSDSRGRAAAMRVTIRTKCPDGQVPNIWSFGDVCKTCLTGAVCSVEGLKLPYAKDGYFRNSETRAIVPCSPVDACPSEGASAAVAISLIPDEDAYEFSRNGTYIRSDSNIDTPTFMGLLGSSNTVCSAGYYGERCSECESGYFRKSGVCMKCPESNISPILMIAIIVGASAIGIYIYVWLSSLKMDFGNVFIGITFFQVLSVFVDFPEIKWPAEVRQIFDLAQTLMFSVDLLATECMVKTNTFSSYEFKLQLVIGFPIVITVNFLLAYIFYRIWLLTLRPLFVSCGVVADIQYPGDNGEESGKGKGSLKLQTPKIVKSAPEDDNNNNEFDENGDQISGMDRRFSLGQRKSVPGSVYPQDGISLYPGSPNMPGTLSFQGVAGSKMQPRKSSIYSTKGLIYPKPNNQVEEPLDSSTEPDEDGVIIRSPQDRVYYFGIKMFGLWLTFLNIMYLTLFMKSIQVFNCKALPGSDSSFGEFISGEPNKQCYTRDWFQNLVPFAIAGLLGYAFGIVFVSIMVFHFAYKYDPELNFPRSFAFGAMYRQLSNHALNAINTPSLMQLIDNYKNSKIEENGYEQLPNNVAALEHIFGKTKKDDDEDGKKSIPFIGRLCVDVIRLRKNDFTKSFTFWEVLVLLRKASITIAVSLIKDSDTMKIIALQVIFSFALVLQLLARPYKRREFNSLEEVTFWSLQLILTAAMAFKSGAAQSEVLKGVLAWAIVGLVGICSTVIIFMTLRELKKYWGEFKSKVGKKIHSAD